MSSLALDLGELTGWACTNHLVGCVELSDVLSFYDWLRDTRDAGVDLILYEDAFRQRGKASAQFNKRLGVLELYCEQHKIPHLGIGVSTWQAWARRQGVLLPTTKDEPSAAKRRKIRKALLLQEARDRSGLFVPDDNAADAWWVLQYLLANKHRYEGI